MEIFADLLIFGFVFASGIILALIATWFSRRYERGRGALIVAAFFLPFLFTAYLIYASELRDSFHVSRSEAGEDNGFDTLPLQDGYKLSYFYETPSDASIWKGGKGAASIREIEHVQRVEVLGSTIFGETGRSGMLDSPPDFFFALNTRSGAIQEFGTEEELRSNFATLGTLKRPEDVYRGALAYQRSNYFWPIVEAGPFLIAAACWFLMKLTKTN